MGYHFHFSFDTFLLSLNPSFAASYIPTPGARALFYSYLHGQTRFPKLRLIHPPSRSRTRHLLHPIFSFAIPATAIFKVNSRFRCVSAPTDAGAGGWKIYALFAGKNLPVPRKTRLQRHRRTLSHPALAPLARSFPISGGNFSRCLNTSCAATAGGPNLEAPDKYRRYSTFRPVAGQE